MSIETRILRGVLIFFAICGAAVALFYLTLPWTTLRYRLIIEAEANGQPLTGSGVIEVSYQKQPDRVWAMSLRPALVVSRCGSTSPARDRSLR